LYIERFSTIISCIQAALAPDVLDCGRATSEQAVMYGSVVEIHCGQEVVLLGRFAPGRLPHELLTRGRAQTVLSRLAATPDAMSKIRHYWSAHRSSHSVMRLSDHDLLKVVGGAIQNGQLQAIVFPRSWPDRTQGAAQVAGRQAPAAMAQTAQPRWPAAPAARSTLAGIASAPSEPAGILPSPPAQPRPVSQWSPEERIAEVIRRALPKVPGDVGQALLSLLTPESLAIIAGTIAIGVAANLTPYGWAADAFIMGVAFGFGGVAAIYALGDLVECFKRTANAQSDQDLDVAADALARAVVVLGAVGLMAVLHRVGPRAGGGGAGDASVGEAAEVSPRAVRSVKADRPAVDGAGSTPKAVEPSPPVAKGLPATTEESVADKLQRYLLNPDHPEGASKAKFFDKALGFTRANSGDLAKQLVFNPDEAIQTSVTQFGQKFEQVTNVVGANGRTVPIKTAWIKNNDGVVRLITAVPGD
jgi:hypothetical protein